MGGGGGGGGAAAAATAVVAAVSRVVRVSVSVTHRWAVRSTSLSFVVVVRCRSSFVVLIGVASAAQVGVSTNPPVMRVVVWVLTFLCSLLSPLVVR